MTNVLAHFWMADSALCEAIKVRCDAFLTAGDGAVVILSELVEELHLLLCQLQSLLLDLIHLFLGIKSLLRHHQVLL